MHRVGFICEIIQGCTVNRTHKYGGPNTNLNEICRKVPHDVTRSLHTALMQLGASSFGANSLCLRDLSIYGGATERCGPIHVTRQYSQYVVTSSASTAASIFRVEGDDIS